MKHSFILFLLTIMLSAQSTAPTALNEVNPRVYLLKNAVVHVEPGKTLDNAAVLIRDGFIENVASRIDAPPDARVLDLDGGHLYAGFVDAWVEVEAPSQPRSPRANWIDVVNPDWMAADCYTPDEKLIQQRRDLGFTSMHVGTDKGIFRGQSALIDLDEKASLTRSSVGQVLDFYTRPRGEEGYPGALLGTIAVMRQVLYDADWYAQAQSIYAKYPDRNDQPQEDLALASLAASRAAKQPFLFKTSDELSAQRALRIGDEFGLETWLMGSGYEYRRLAEISSAKPFVILPLDFPGKPDVTHPYLADQYTTEQLKHWAMAPDNPRKLAENSLDMGFTTHGLKDIKQFRKNLSLAIERGLSEASALAGLTTTPAEKFGLGKTQGKIKAGYQADLVLVRGSYFNEENPVLSLWIRGEKYDTHAVLEPEIAGSWTFSMDELSCELTFKSRPGHTAGQLRLDSTRISLKDLNVDGSILSWHADLTAIRLPGVTRFRGSCQDARIEGTAIKVDGSVSKWTATRKPDPEKKDIISKLGQELVLNYPEGAFGFQTLPAQPELLFVQDATLWTSGPLGIIEKGDMLIQKGRIKQIGSDLTPPSGATIIEARGRYVTPGLIDPHSHTAASSVNEGTQSITSEVRIQDVLDPDDIAIYRELAGGLTTIHVLHGSANTIGGQNSVIKLRWGADAQGLIMKRAPEYLKFALGENVKQSNWGDDNVTRYPQTRMGVEQVLRDAFTRARDYKKNLDAHAAQSRWRTTRIPPRKDLELDALVEVLEGTRRVHVHSYRQDEILMMIRVGEEFGFTVHNMEHVLEGYKVAEHMAQHGVGAATFSDWWAYKFEVYDAIPYNAALMQEQGVLVAFKSDSDELARRMNLEAAKGIKYGGMSRIEAMNTVTINPAKQLGIEKWVGSLEVGKDADFVIWSHDPLSTQAVCQETWLDGRRYFSIEDNTRMLEADRQIRLDLIQRILASPEEEDHEDAPAPENHRSQNPYRDDQAWEGGVR